MKFTPDRPRGNVIRSFSAGEIRLESQTLHSHAVISLDTIIAWEPPPVAELSFADFAPALELQPDIILFGTGLTQQFPSMHVMTEIMRAGVAIEVMHTDAACRTFNVLIGENRAAVAALLVE